ncbi:MAG: hypothetical protein QGG54_08985 [Gammaproteobacteria bacterium]|jgi:hypothetical protein|nr:hypothetical protein [Gammaproteobacteria bacterium]|tara:strand:+ start:907 stop:1128 length:222 start_codon:yes stop_codon:yes gene_type:complete
MDDIHITNRGLVEENRRLTMTNKELEEDLYCVRRGVQGVRLYLESAWESYPDAALVEACQMLDELTGDHGNAS